MYTYLLVFVEESWNSFIFYENCRKETTDSSLSSSSISKLSDSNNGFKRLWWARLRPVLALVQGARMPETPIWMIGNLLIFGTFYTPFLVLVLNTYCTIVHCTYIVHCTMYNVVYIVHCTLYIVHCTLYIVQDSVQNFGFVWKFKQ